jgi:hypothetical protein
MLRRTPGIVLAALLILAGCSSGDDEPIATLGSVTTPPSLAPADPGNPTPPPGGPAVTLPDFGPAPSEILTTADLAGIEGLAGFTMRPGIPPEVIAGLCNHTIEYSKVWRVVARNDGDVQRFGQAVFEVEDPDAAAAFVAKLQSAKQGCTWQREPYVFEYVSQETGVTPVGDAMYAYRIKIGRVTKGTPDQLSLLVFVQKGNKLIHVHAPPDADLAMINKVLAAAVA